MKKLIFLFTVMIILLVSSLFSQVAITRTIEKGESFGNEEAPDFPSFTDRTVIFNEGFETSMMTFPPAGWTRHTLGSHGDRPWNSHLGPSTAHSGNICAASPSWWTGVGAISPNNYLITPAISLPLAMGISLQYYIAPQGQEGPAETYSLYLSTSGTAVEDFNTLLDTQTFANTQWQEKIIDLSAYAGQDVWIAWRHHASYNQGFLRLDTISISEIAGKDLVATSLTGPHAINIYQLSSFQVQVTNVGAIDISAESYTVRLLQGTEEIVTPLSGVAIASGGTANFNFGWTPTITGSYNLIAEVVYPEDSVLTNNQTKALNVHVFPEGNLEVLVGDPQSTTNNNNIPFYNSFTGSISQNIYLESEIQALGAIYGLEWKYINTSSNYTGLEEIQIWLATTTKTAFSNTTDWISGENFMQVYEGTFPFNLQGTNNVKIYFDQAFMYYGDNLVIMAQKKPLVSGATAINSFHSTNRTTNRALRLGSDSTLYEIDDLPAGSLITATTNVVLMMATGALGTVNGNITFASLPLGDVVITLTKENITRISKTNSLGTFTLPFVAEGAYTLHATKELFQDAIIPHINVLANQITSIPTIEMTQPQYDLAAISITGMSMPPAESPLNYTVLVQNVGGLVPENDSYIVRIMQVNSTEDTVLAEKEGIAILGGEFYSFVIPVNFALAEEVNIYGTVVFTPESSIIDEHESNNQTPTLCVKVQLPGRAIVPIGNQWSSSYTTEYPVNYYWSNSVVQQIILADDIALEGAITSLQYRLLNTSATLPPARQTQIFLASTNKSQFTSDADWISLSEFTPVYQGLVSIPDHGEQDIIFPLPTPYPYEGGNLVVMTYNPWFTGAITGGNTWQVTSTSRSSVLIYSSSTIGATLEDYNIYPGIISSHLNNVQLHFITTAMGNINGMVTNISGNPISNATITISGVSVDSNPQGEFIINHLPIGYQIVTATARGYLPYISAEPIMVIAGETSTFSIIMQFRSPVEVTGQIIASDTNQGLQGVTVKLSGIENYETTTLANGTFIFPEVYTGNIYQLTATKTGYHDYHQNSIDIGDDPLVIPPITLCEKAIPPLNVQVLIIGNDTIISWDEPIRRGEENPQDHSVIPSLLSPINMATRGSFYRWQENHHLSADQLTKNNRSLVGYRIFRSAMQDIALEENWTTLATIQTDTSYTDFTWNTIPDNGYYYFVKAIFTNDNFSAPAMSNLVSKGMTANVIITLNTDNALIPFGAQVKLVNNSGNINHIYQEVTESDMITIPDVWMGEYTLSVRRSGYENYLDQTVLISTNPTNINVLLTATSLLLSENFENGEFPPAGWQAKVTNLTGYGWGRGFINQNWFAYSESYVVLFPGFGIPVEPDNWLISPPIIINPATKVDLTFDTAIYNVNNTGDNFSVYISTTSSDPEDFVLEFNDVADDSYTQWVNHQIDLSPYAGERIYLAFRHHDCSNNAMLLLDNIELRAIPLASISDVEVGGMVIASDTNEGLGGATIRLTGEENYETITTPGGTFYFPAVATGKTYRLTISQIGYTEYVDPLFTVGYDALVLDPIVLNEKAVAPTEVVAEIVGNNVLIHWEMPDPSSSSFLSSAPNSLHITKQIHSNHSFKSIEEDENRTLLAYKVFRSPMDDVDNAENWIVLAENHSSTTITDITWNSLPNDGYYYFVQAIYTNTNLSIPTRSNLVSRGMTGNVTITLQTDDDRITTGAIVKLINNSGEASHVYSMIVETHQAIFPAVWVGSYTLKIILPGYIQYINSEILVSNMTTEITASLQSTELMLNEDFEADIFPPEGWTTMVTNEDGFDWRQGFMAGNKVAFSESFVWIIPGLYGIPVAPDNWLITPQLRIREETEVSLKFSVGILSADKPAENYTVYVSTTGVSPTDFFPILNEVTTPSFTTWMERNIDLNEYAGKDIYLAFRHHDCFDMSYLLLDNIELRAIKIVPEIGHENEKFVNILYPNYPNPFNPSTMISFLQKTAGNVQIDIFNLKGQKVRVLTNQEYIAGKHFLEWNGTDDNGKNVSSGVYFYRLKTANYTAQRKMILMK